MANNQFKFDISLSVLNHLGRNLYRSFITVLGEAVSNSWDADANNVWIYIDRENNTLVVKDDGIGMSANDFQDKFLTIGYSKRAKNGEQSLTKKRPYIGRKGIGKLALLSCSEKISVISRKKETNDYTGGTIDNTGLDEAIKEDLKTNEYLLGNYKIDDFAEYKKNHKNGTIIIFYNIKDGIKNRVEYLKQVMALYFRFSLIDDSFNIYVNDDKISVKDLNSLAEKTEFIWTINNFKDPYINILNNIKEKNDLSCDAISIKGFITSVDKPRDLKIFNSEEKITVDIFVNGRLREKDFTRNMSDLIANSYLYGQIHYDDLDNDNKDRFTSSREGIIQDDEKYKKFLEIFKKDIFTKILNQWDELRTKNAKTGDNENEAVTKQKRAARDLYNASRKDYSDSNDKVKKWLRDLQEDAEFNLESYSQCFISENLVRKYIRDKNISFNDKKDILNKIKIYKDNENKNKGLGGVSIDIRANKDDLNYLAMKDLSDIADKKDYNTDSSLSRDAKSITSIRDAVMHTATLTIEAKEHLKSIYKNIEARIKELLK